MRGKTTIPGVKPVMKFLKRRGTRIWDWPVRVFHWSFSGGWIAALVIALLTSQSGKVFPFHALIGLTLGFVVLLRIVWGICGTSPARFSAFAFGPRRLLAYMKDAAGFRETHFAGHNPGAAWVIFAMLGLTLAQVAIGLCVGAGMRNLRQLHEVLAYVMIGLIAGHLLGIALHTLRHRELIGLSMVDGKRAVEAENAIVSTRPVIGALAALLILGFCYRIYRNYNEVGQTTRLPLIGVEIRIGEGEPEDWD